MLLVVALLLKFIIQRIIIYNLNLLFYYVIGLASSGAVRDSVPRRM